MATPPPRDILNSYSYKKQCVKEIFFDSRRRIRRRPAFDGHDLMKQVTPQSGGPPMFKPLITAALFAAFATPAALAGPAERLGRADHRLTAAEIRGDIPQDSRADAVENRIDRYENKVDRRESRRDEAMDNGPRDVAEDRLDRAENALDRREDRIDRRN
jgi:hypothetical protein